jgi:ERCC4-type nuclease
MEQPNPPLVTVDDREDKDSPAVRRLEARGARLQYARLATGDFTASDRCAIERKTAADLEASITDGRLFSQARKLSEGFQSPVIGVVGKSFTRLGPRQIEGAVVSLLVDYRIPVMFFASEEKLADFIYTAACREQLEEKRAARSQHAQKPESPLEARQYVVQSLPGIGPLNAKALLEEFGTVENVFTADEEKLCAVPGIGQKTAKSIRTLLVAGFTEG